MNSTRRSKLLVGAALCLAAWLPAGTAAQEPTAKLRDSGLVERADAVLTQIDVTVIGAPEILRELSAADFRIKINRTNVKEFTLDRVCALDGDPTEEAGSPAEAPALRAGPSAHYLIYFDQSHLTLMGRAQALDIARELIPLLVEAGGEVMLVSNAAKLTVFEPFSTDPSSLLEAVDRLENDRTQWTMFAEQEDDRVRDVIRVLNEQGQVGHAVSVARRHHKEEVAVTDRNMRRLRLTISQLADLAPPTAVVYFGDTLRKNPGAHYLSFFGQGVQQDQLPIGGMKSGTLLSGLAFDTVINEAAAQGVRLYTIQAEGLIARMYADLPGATGMAQSNQVAAPRSMRSRDARNTLHGMAAETGGQAFLHGGNARKIGERIVADSACIFLISFDPTGFRYDQPLRTVVTTQRDDIQLRVRGRLVVQSPSAKRTASLLRAFGSPDAIEDPFELRSQIVPTGFSDGAYTALLQLSVPGTPLQQATWELGASIVYREKVHDEAAGSLSISVPGLPVVFERELQFKPGEYQVVSVAHEARTGMISSVQHSVRWPDPNAQPATASAIAILQPQRAAFLRGTEARSSGSLALGAGEPVDPRKPVALVGVICRGRRDRGPLSLRRTLIGDSEIELPPLALDLSSDRCAQLRDLIPADTLGPGRYRYGLFLEQGENREELARVEFSVAP